MAKGAESVDYLVTAHTTLRLAAPRIGHEEHARHRLHAVVGDRRGPRQRASRSRRPCANAKAYVSAAIAAADRLSVGKGHGPVHHFYAFERGTPVV